MDSEPNTIPAVTMDLMEPEITAIIKIANDLNMNFHIGISPVRGGPTPLSFFSNNLMDFYFLGRDFAEYRIWRRCKSYQKIWN